MVNNASSGKLSFILLAVQPKWAKLEGGSNMFHLFPCSTIRFLVAYYWQQILDGEKSKGKFLYSAVSNPQVCSEHFTLTSLTDLFNQTPSQLLWEASSHMLQLMREDCSTTVNSQVVNTIAQGFNTAAQDLNPGPLIRESEALWDTLVLTSTEVGHKNK